MKVQAKNLKLMLIVALLLQAGCKKEPMPRGQFLGGWTQAGDQTQAGDLFRKDNPGGGNGWNGALNNLLGNGNGNGNNGNTGGTGNVLDSDGDGVLDNVDKCNSTPGSTVDSNGCEIISEPAKTVVAPEKVSWEELGIWAKHCETLGVKAKYGSGADEDLDGISDDCENLLSDEANIKKEVLAKLAEDQKTDPTKTIKDMNAEIAKYYLPALDSKIFNGALISTKEFSSERDPFLGSKEKRCSEEGLWDQTICLIKNALIEDLMVKGVKTPTTINEKEAWKRFKEKGGIGAESETKLDNLIIKKFGAHSVIRKDNNIAAMRDIFKIEQQQISDKDKTGLYQSYFDTDFQLDAVKLGGTDFSSLTSLKYALVTGDIPFPVDSPASALSDFTGLPSGFDSFRTNAGFFYVAETNLVVPSTGIELQIGQLVRESGKDSIRIGKSAGIFMIMNGNNIKIVSTDMITNKGSTFEGKNNSKLKPEGGCQSAHIVIVFLADEKTLENAVAEAIFAENVFYREEKEHDWKPISQQMMSIKPRGGKSCTLSEDYVMFEEAKTVLMTVAPL